MEKRPIFKPELTTTDKVTEIAGWLLLLGIWGVTLANYSNLPETIPIHYNSTGQADGLGTKASILTLPLIATILFAGLTLLNKFPHLFNYPIPITKDNALRQYRSATRLISCLKLMIVIIFGLIAFRTIQNAAGQANGLGVWFLPLTMGLIVIPLISFVIKSIRSKQEANR